MALSVGNAVQLCSGGPLMTIASIDGDTIGCKWFATLAATDVSATNLFPAILLRVSGPNEGVAGWQGNPTILDLGDVVQLRSGGPLMTVSSVSGTTIGCAWFSSTTSTAPNGITLNFSMLVLRDPPNDGLPGQQRAKGNA